jgi:hypothetical protein
LSGFRFPVWELTRSCILELLYYFSTASSIIIKLNLSTDYGEGVVGADFNAVCAGAEVVGLREGAAEAAGGVMRL